MLNMKNELQVSGLSIQSTQSEANVSVLSFLIKEANDSYSSD